MEKAPLIKRTTTSNSKSKTTSTKHNTSKKIEYFHFIAILMFIISVLIYIFLITPFSNLSVVRESTDIKYHSDHESAVSKLFRILNIRKIPFLQPQTQNEHKVNTENFIQKYNAVFTKWSNFPKNTKCFSVPEFPTDRRKNSSRLRIASYNVEWLFLFGGSGSIKCPGKSCPWFSHSHARDHFIKTAHLLTKLDADIIHLNEVEDCRILGAILDFLPDNHGYRAYMIDGTDTMTGQNVALLSRIDPVFDLKRTESRATYPIAGSTCGDYSNYSNTKFKENYKKKRKRTTMGLSKHYLTGFNIPLNEDNRSLSIVWAGAHFIAFPADIDRCMRREAQATVLSRLIKSELYSSSMLDQEQTEIIITGDFNDHDGEIPGANEVKPLSSVLQILKQDLQLKSVAAHVNDPLHRYSSWHDLNKNCMDDGPKEHSLIDHILVSQGLSDRIVSVWMDHNNTVSCTNRTSDHWPIIVDIQT